MAEIIVAQGVGKMYRLGEPTAYRVLRERVTELLAAPFRRRRAAEGTGDEILWALKDVGFSIDESEVVGLIGRNGAGKSTLLKILSRITQPTEGRIDLYGKASSLLEVGIGFHPELSGRENIYLNGAILGMGRQEIRARFDEIVEFAEISRFLDTPVKRYSSGMSVRLAFAVAAHLEPEILLVDEVLAVGDASFQRKSLGKMNEVAREGRTVVFVSHNLAIIQALCTRGILLERGEVVTDAPVTEAIDSYLRTLEQAASQDLLERSDRDSRAWKEMLVRRLALVDVQSGLADAVVAGRPVRFELELTETMPMTECRLTILNSLGQPVAT